MLDGTHCYSERFTWQQVEVVQCTLSNCCIPVSQVATRRHLRSAARHQPTVPWHRLGTYGRRAFAVAGPTMFNALPDDLYEILQSAHRPSNSRWRLIFYLPISTFSALGVSRVMRSINVRYLLTYCVNKHQLLFSCITVRKSNQFERKFQTK